MSQTPGDTGAVNGTASDTTPPAEEPPAATTPPSNVVEQDTGGVARERPVEVVQARRSGSRAVNLHVHWEEELESPAGMAAAASDEPLRRTAPAMDRPAAHAPEPLQAPDQTSQMASSTIHVVQIMQLSCHQQAAVLPITYVPRLIFLAGHQPAMLLNSPMAAPVARPPPIGTGSWCYPNRREPFWRNAAAQYRTNPPVVLSPGDPRLALVGHSGYLVINSSMR